MDNRSIREQILLTHTFLISLQERLEKFETQHNDCEYKKAVKFFNDATNLLMFCSQALCHALPEDERKLSNDTEILLKALQEMFNYDGII